MVHIHPDSRETKTQAGNRRAVLLPKALEALKNQKPYSFVGGDFVFVRPMDRGPFVDYEHLERLWKHILKCSGVHYRNPYQTRHTYASQLLSGGENPLFVAEHYRWWIEQHNLRDFF